ncbi:hypothetical protein Glove_155g33 [Diversispora epigaea]|uniref:Uncharacterized protein n=1 Tax=Diversispora epigaea TaxID=1348612 RepID=A0A397ISC7_9GLOM|nr:hypothetical protein Glove_155g33 [Diversispora epigaea]
MSSTASVARHCSAASTRLKAGIIPSQMANYDSDQVTIQMTNQASSNNMNNNVNMQTKIANQVLMDSLEFLQ